MLSVLCHEDTLPSLCFIMKILYLLSMLEYTPPTLSAKSVLCHEDTFMFVVILTECKVFG